MKCAVGIVCFACCSIGAAQSIRFDLAYGDPETAALNGKSVGDFLDPSGVTKIGRIGTRSVFQLWLSTYEEGLYLGGNAFVGFDQATVTGSKTYMSRADAEKAGVAKKLTLDTEYSNFGKGFLAFSDLEQKFVATDLEQAIYGAAGAARFRAAATGSGAGGGVATFRSIGLNFLYNFGIGNRFVAVRNARHRFLDIGVVNRDISLGEIFGDDSNENGLTLNREASGGAAGGNFMQHNYTAPSLKYQLQAVPEPATILAISAGLATLARRRKK